MRFEGDGYLPDMAGNLRATSMKFEGGQPSVDELASSLESAGRAQAPAQSKPLLHQITDAGTVVPQQAVFELKTRSLHRNITVDIMMSDALPRLLIRQIPNLILAYHDRGHFTDIDVKDVREDIADWQADNQAHLRRFAGLLKRIVQAARSAKGGKLEVTVDGSGTQLHVREQLADAPAACSPSTAAEWKNWLAGKADSEGSELRVDSKKAESGSEDAAKVEDGKAHFAACDDQY